MIEIKEKPVTEELKKHIHAAFGAHATSITGHNELFDPIAYIADEQDSFVGAVVVQIFWGALHIKNLYVEDRYREQGIGSHLMERAFQYARNNKCSFAFVETMSFQALDFYRKMGFELEFTRPGYKHGTSFHYLRKTLE